MVGLAGLEPATSRPPDERATRLRYSPNQARIAGMRPLLQGLSVDFAGGYRWISRVLLRKCRQRATHAIADVF